MRTVVLCLLAGVVGCGGAGHVALDLGAPPDLADTSGCHPSFPRSYIVNNFTMRGYGDGFDLNGDGKPDNALGALSSFANPKWNDAITKGYAIYLFDFDQLDGPPLVDGSTVALSFFVGIDADADATNNLGGSGQFYVPAEAFDVNCQSTAGFDHLMVQNGRLTGDRQMLNIVAQGVGSLPFENVKLDSTLDANYGQMSGSVGDISTACALSLTPSGVNQSSLLDVVAGTFQLQPDMDLNGDGLDTVTVDGSGAVASCTSATGDVIQGPDCACDPRIHDGYSAAMDFTAVPAQILGLSTAP